MYAIRSAVLYMHKVVLYMHRADQEVVQVLVRHFYLEETVLLL